MVKKFNELKCHSLIPHVLNYINKKDCLNQYTMYYEVVRYNSLMIMFSVPLL